MIIFTKFWKLDADTSSSFRYTDILLRLLIVMSYLTPHAVQVIIIVRDSAIRRRNLLQASMVLFVKADSDSVNLQPLIFEIMIPILKMNDDNDMINGRIIRNSRNED